MALPPPTPPAAAPRQETPRVQLARVAGAAARAEAGVTGLDAGPAGLQATFAGTERLPGVTVNADGDDGRYAVALFVAAEPVDLGALGGRVVAAVQHAASAAGLADALGSVHVTVTDLTLPSETTSA